MAVQEQTPYIEYVANGITTSFALEFDCDNQDHLIVLVDDVEPVVGAWSFSNGAVVFNTAPENGKKITIQRNTPFSRTTDYQSYNNSFRPPSVNKDFDWVWLKLQELGVADWILSNRIDALKNYVDDRDDELRAYLMEEIRKQGVALDQLDEYYNYLMQRLAQIAVDKGWDSSFISHSLLKNKITRTLYDKLYETWSIKDFGAIGDGTLHTLQEWVNQGKFSGLAAIQVVFPFVTSLTESIDRVAIQGAIKALPLNTADAGILTPKGFANGGCIKIPRGRYIIDKKVNMQRGLRLVGESRESSQLISFISNDSVLQYADAGRYIQDEIIIQNLSIWQDPSVVATAGAAIDVIEGAATVLSLYMNIDNVYIEGTYYGIRHMAGVGSAIRNSNISKCVNHGVYLTGIYSTTSTVFENTYSHQNGGDGFNIEKGAYIAFVACASDSNVGFGYKLNQTRGYSFTGCGAEVNQKAALNLLATGGGDINLFAISNLEGVAKLESNVGAVKFSGGDWEGTGFAIRNVGVSKVHLDGTVLTGDYATNRSDAIAFLLDESSNSVGKLVGGTKNQWAIGVSQQPDSDGGFTVGGVASNSTAYGFKANQQFTSAVGARNAALFSQFISSDTAVTYPLAISNFVLNASKGAASTIQRSAGTYIQEQTQGAAANANIMIDGGQGTVPVGNWSIYNGSTRPSYHGGSLTWKPATSATPANNGDLTFEKTSDTELKIKVKGSDGVVRSATLTLS